MKRKPTTTDPAADVTPDDALKLAATAEERLEDSPRELARFLLFLRWNAFHSTASDRETLYIRIEGLAMPFMDGIDEAVRAQMSTELDALRKGGAR
jgi:hypothetical protein